MPHLRKGAMRDFLNIMKMTNRYVDSHWNRTNSIYTFGNGSFIEFFPADSADKLRGSRRNILFVNECNNISNEAFNQLSMRSDKDIYLDYNPSNKFWVDEVLKSDEAERIILTYKDNEALSPTIINFLESKRELALTSEYWENWCKVYLDGLQGMLEGVIFQNWTTIPNVPIEAKLIGIGLDWGFSNDPSAATAVYRYDGKLILDEILYDTGLFNKDISDRITEYLRTNNISDRISIYADSAEPKSIAELRKFGHMIFAAKKGKDSINYGIETLQQYDIQITKSSFNIIDEFSRYSWKVDKNGMTLSIPEDTNNHCFTGETLITTNKGDVMIKDIIEGDMVLTSDGYNKVLKKWDNGLKQVDQYRMETDTFDIYISSTPEHKVKTNKGWIQISKLKSGMIIYLNNNSMERNTHYTEMRDISHEEQDECIQMYGKNTIVKYPKDTTFTTSMKTPGIIESKILNVSKLPNTYQTTVKKELKITQSGSKISMKRELKQRKNGTVQKRVENGIVSNQKKVGRIGSIENWSVLFVEKNTKQDTVGYQNIVITTVKQWQVEGERRVYDLMVQNKHEYFANGMLVHNCVDGIRYLAISKLNNPSLDGQPRFKIR